MVKHSESNNKGFTLLEMLVVVAIIAILIALAYGLFKDQVIKAKVATDSSNVRNAKALAITAHLEHKKNAVYVYDANQGSVLVKDEDNISDVKGYGQTPYSYSKSLATDQIQEETYGAIGHPISDSGTKNFVCVRIAKGAPVRCYWSSGKCSNVPSVPKDDNDGGGGVTPNPIPPKPNPNPEPDLTLLDRFKKYYIHDDINALKPGHVVRWAGHIIYCYRPGSDYPIWQTTPEYIFTNRNFDSSGYLMKDGVMAGYGDIYWDGANYRFIMSDYPHSWYVNNWPVINRSYFE